MSAAMRAAATPAQRDRVLLRGASARMSPALGAGATAFRTRAGHPNGRVAGPQECHADVGRQVPRALMSRGQCSGPRAARAQRCLPPARGRICALALRFLSAGPFGACGAASASRAFRRRQSHACARGYQAAVGGPTDFLLARSPSTENPWTRTSSSTLAGQTVDPRPRRRRDPHHRPPAGRLRRLARRCACGTASPTTSARTRRPSRSSSATPPCCASWCCERNPIPLADAYFHGRLDVEGDLYAALQPEGALPAPVAHAGASARACWSTRCASLLAPARREALPARCAPRASSRTTTRPRATAPRSRTTTTSPTRSTGCSSTSGWSTPARTSTPPTSRSSRRRPTSSITSAASCACSRASASSTSAAAGARS